MIRLASFLFGVLLLVGCESGIYYQDTYKPEDNVWKHSDLVDFDFSIADSTAMYNMYLDITHETSYPFQNLYVMIRSVSPDGLIIEDQHSLELQEKGGAWIGGCNAQKCEIRFILREGFTFPMSGSYTIQLEQNTRTEALKGVREIGLVIEKVKS